MTNNSDKQKLVYSGYVIAFDGAGSLNFGNDLVKNVLSFVAGSSSLSHACNCKTSILVFWYFWYFGEGPT